MPNTTLDAPDRTGLAPLAAWGAICLIWGSTFYAVRIAVETIPPWTMMGVRAFIAGVILTVIALASGASMPGRRGLASAAASGTLMFLCGHGVLAWAEMRVPSAAAAVLTCTVSLFTPIAAWIVGAARRPTALAVTGLAVGFAGVVILVDPAAGHLDTVGCVALVLCNICWAFAAAIARRCRPAASALLGSALQLVIGGAVCLSAGGLRGEWSGALLAHVSERSALGLAYLIVFGSLIAFACYGWLVQVWQPDRASTYAYINPIVAMMIGVGLAGEVFGVREFLASALILGAVAMVMVGPKVAEGSSSFLKKRTKKLLGV